MKYYVEILKKIERRKIIQRIKLLFCTFLDNFTEGDKVSITKFFYSLYRIANMLEAILSVFVYMLLFYKISNSYIALLLCGAYLVLSMYFEGRLQIDKIRNEMAYLLKYMPAKKEIDKLIYVHWRFYEFYRFIIVIIAVNLAQCAFRNFSIKFFAVSLIFICSVALCSITIFYAKVYRTTFFKIWSLKENDLSCIHVNEDDEVEKIVTGDYYTNILSRLVKYSVPEYYEKIAMIILALIILGLKLLQYFLNIKMVYIDVIVFNAFPTLINFYLLNLITKSFLAKDFVNMNYYMIKKYNIRKYMIKCTRKTLLDKTKSLIIIWCLLIALITLFDWRHIILSAFCVIQWFVIVQMLSIKTYSYSKYDFDDIKTELYANLMQNPFEEMFIIGLPVALCALVIYIVVQKNFQIYIVLMLCYTCGLIAYSLVLTMLSNRRMLMIRESI